MKRINGKQVQDGTLSPVAINNSAGYVPSAAGDVVTISYLQTHTYTTAENGGIPLTARNIINYYNGLTGVDNVGLTRTDVSLGGALTAAASVTMPTTAGIDLTFSKSTSNLRSGKIDFFKRGSESFTVVVTRPSDNKGWLFTPSTTTYAQTYDHRVIGGIAFVDFGNEAKMVNTTNIPYRPDNGGISDISWNAVAACMAVIGTFTGMNGNPTRGLAVFTEEMTSLVETLEGGTGLNGTPLRCFLYDDLSVLVVGPTMTDYNGTAIKGIIRLIDDGLAQYMIDPTFNGVTTGFLSTDSISDLHVDQITGKILIGGNFGTYNGTTVHKLIQLNADGSLDSTFMTNIGTGINSGTSVKFAVDSNNAITIVGNGFTQFNGVAKPNIVRLNSDGTVDGTFNSVGTGFSGTQKTAVSVMVQSTNKIIISGRINAYNGQASYSGTNVNGLIRLNTNGSLDTTFNSGNAGYVVSNNIVGGRSAIFSDDKIYLANTTNAYNGYTPSINMLRLNADGTVAPYTKYGFLGDIQPFRYAADISAEYDDRSLVDRGYLFTINSTYVAGKQFANTFSSGQNGYVLSYNGTTDSFWLASPVVLTVSNGLTNITTTSAKLGGVLTEATTIDTNSLYDFKIHSSIASANNIVEFSGYINTTILSTLRLNGHNFNGLDQAWWHINETGGAYESWFKHNGASVELYAMQLIGGSATFNLAGNSAKLNVSDGSNQVEFGLSVSNSGCYFKDFRTGINPSGIVYFADYSANYTIRSLVDKGYVSSAIANIRIGIHNITTPSTGGTVNLIVNQYNIINPAGTLATLTVNLPSSPANNDYVIIKYTQSVATVTYGNGTVADGIIAPSAGGFVMLVYNLGDTTWY